MPTDDDDDDRPARRPRRDDDDDDRPARRPKSSRDDDDDDRPARRPRDDNEDDYDDAPPRKQKRGEGLAIASMITGIISIPFSCCCGWLSLPLSVTSLILGFVDRSKNGPNGKATAGIICACVAIFLAILGIVLAALDVFKFDPRQFQK